MSKNVIALGNKLMMDDAVALFIIENIKDALESQNIKVILGETDIDFCFSKLNTRDEFYIVDACLSDNIPGTVIFKKLEEVKEEKTKNVLGHSLGLIDLINIYKLNIKGYFIGIEIGNIYMNIGLSNVLQKKFNTICNKTLNFIIKN